MNAMCGLTRARAWPHTTWVVQASIGYQSSPVTLMCGRSGHRSRTDGLLLVRQSLQSLATTPTELSVWWSIHTVWARQRDSEWIIVSMNGGVKWSSLDGVPGSELSDDIYCARSRQLANADQYCMEITGFEDTAKHPLTTALPENRPPNRNCGFFLKTEPKPTDLGQCKTVTTLPRYLSSIPRWRYQYRQSHDIPRYIVAVKNIVKRRKYREYRRYHVSRITGQRAVCKRTMPKRTY